VWSGDNILTRIGTHTIEGALQRISPSIVVPQNGETVLGDGRVRVGEIELSNVSALESSIDMIQTQRNFDHAVQAVQTYRKIDDRAIQVGKV
jgi:flagellar basal-body rod protein FlgF